MNHKFITIIRRETEVTIVPYGNSIILYPGQEVLVIQSLGYGFTINFSGKLAFLDGDNSDAIGKEKKILPSDNKQNILNKTLILNQISMLYDPEIPVNIVDLGLIYDIGIEKLDSKNFYVGIRMTLTSPTCGMGTILAKQVENMLKKINNITSVDVMLVFDPPWNSNMLSESAKLELGIL